MKRRGITLLIAVVILASAMSIALGIAFIVLAEFNINRSARESYESFYAADFGKECALFYHSGNADPDLNRLDSFWSPFNPCFDNGTCGSLIQCGTVSASVTHTTDDGSGSPCTTEVDCRHTYNLTLNDFPNSLCTSVKVVAKVLAFSSFTTLIESHGVNSCDFSNNGVNRSIEVCDAPPGKSC